MIENIKHYGLFRVDVFRIVFDLPHQEIAEYCMDVIDKAGCYTSYFDQNYNRNFKENIPHKEKLEGDLFRAADEFVKKTGRKPFAQGGGHRLNYWCSAYKENDQHGSHIHPRSLISGTYYPQTPDNAAAITLESPWIERMMHETIDLKHVLFDYKPATGDCLMWPSWLNHRVNVQGKTDIPRIAISFNIDYNQVIA